MIGKLGFILTLKIHALNCGGKSVATKNIVQTMYCYIEANALYMYGSVNVQTSNNNNKFHPRKNLNENRLESNL